MQEIVGEVLLDHIALVAQADDEVIDAKVRVDLHDVPDDRLAAYLDHRFWPQVGFFADTRTQAAGQNDCFHYLLTLRAFATIRADNLLTKAVAERTKSKNVANL
ncbi:hypothetical protein D3C81_943020 [compost metagenome]